MAARKIVLIGARGFGLTTPDVQIQSFEWSQIGKIQNLRDYDGVILNVLSIDVGQVDALAFVRMLNPFVMTEILEHGGAIVVVGDPRFRWPAQEAPADKPIQRQVAGFDAYRDFLAWTCATCKWDARPGDTIEFDESMPPTYSAYLSHLKRWDYSLAAVTLDRAALGTLYNLDKMKQTGGDFRLEASFLCRNRYKNGLAAELHMVQRQGGWDQKQWGSIVLLPKTDLPEDEAIAIVLRDLFDVESRLPEPVWIADMKAPGQETVDEEVTKLGKSLKAAWGALQDAQNKRDDIRRPLRLLYDTGVSLEEEVRRALRSLGADVEDPTEPGKEDGWLTVEVGDTTFEGVLEVTGVRTEQFSQDKIRQLLDWKYRGVELRQKKYKGIFIGGNAIGSPVAERPHAFADSWEKSAELHNIVAVKTEDLYALLALTHADPTGSGAVVERFWHDLFTTDGVLDCSPYLAPVGATTGANGATP